MIIIIKLFYFMLPAYLANMAPVLGKSIFKRLAVPIDMGKEINGKPVFGKNKTWRGIVLAVSASTIAFIIQAKIYRYPAAKAISIMDYSTATLWIGVLLGLGAIIGDLAKSFFKRRAGIKPGKPWIPFDQIDFTAGALAFASIIYFPGWANAAIIVALSALLHIIVNHIGYYLKIRDVKW